MEKLRLAILDMYDGEPNMGMTAIKDIVEAFAKDIEYKVFDVRAKNEIPDMSYDIFISTGGPGSPYDGDGVWDKNFFAWIDRMFAWNKQNEAKKHVFFICHSFQMVCLHFGLAEVTKRKSRSFGVFPTHKTMGSINDPLFDKLPDPFYVADFRFWQAIHPDFEKMEEVGAKLLCLEKFRPHVPLERALMAIRFSDEIIATQFHPEACPEAMLEKFTKEEQKADIIEKHDEAKYDQIIEDLHDPTTIQLTYDTVLPGFLRQAIESCKSVAVV